MADITDDASELEALQTKVAIENQLAHKRLEPKIRHGATLCHNCDEQVIDMALFCPGGECAEDYERAKRAERMKAV